MTTPDAPAGPVLEHAFIYVDDGNAAAFESAFAEAKQVIATAPGFHWVELHRGVERPGVRLLLVGWNSLDDHLAFRRSDLFAQWRRLIGPYFADDPDVEHFAPLIGRFAG